MKTLIPNRRTIYLTGSLLLLVLLGGTDKLLADDDHYRARELSESGEIMPLEQLLEKIQGYGRVLEVDLESEHGRHVYEIEFLDSEGKVRERYFDASSGELLSDRWKDD